MSRNTWAAADVPYHVSDPRELALISGAEFWAVDCYAPTGEVVEHCQCYDYFSECATASLFLSSQRRRRPRRPPAACRAARYPCSSSPLLPCNVYALCTCEPAALRSSVTLLNEALTQNLWTINYSFHSSAVCLHAGPRSVYVHGL